ncbi:uncharacterized protein METZ01_LOCUS234516 [marine metagenome]|uniref:Uncharacterized protein n=1 Tax=marine metagenome TaxID=408172 RepID=A0A382H3B7_9ZZZZ
MLSGSSVIFSDDFVATNLSPTSVTVISGKNLSRAVHIFLPAGVCPLSLYNLGVILSNI